MGAKAAPRLAPTSLPTLPCTPASGTQQPPCSGHWRGPQASRANFGQAAEGKPSVDPHCGIGRPPCLSQLQGCRPESLSHPNRPRGHSSVWEASHQMFEGEKKSHFLRCFFPFYFLIIFLDDFISKKGVVERRRTGGGRTWALRRPRGPEQCGGRRARGRPRESPGLFSLGNGGLV